MRLIHAILLGVASFFWKGAQVVLGVGSAAAARWAGRRRVSCLAHMLVVGTGWGGDDGAMMLLEQVPDVSGLLEEEIEQRKRRGKSTADHEFALRLVAALR